MEASQLVALDQSCLLSEILTEIEYSRTVNNTTHTNYETVQVADVICSYIESYEGKTCNMEDHILW